MQTLGLNSSTPRTEGRLKALVWPTIRNHGDLDYVTEQGFWVCFIVATATCVFSFFTRALLSGGFESLFYFLAAAGVRQRSKLAAIAAFSAYFLGSLVIQRYSGNGFGVVRIIFLALLLANIRGIWLSSRWKNADSGMPDSVRLSETLFDKLSDQLPSRIWPKARWFFGFVAAIEIAMMLMLLTTPLPPARVIPR